MVNEKTIMFLQKGSAKVIIIMTSANLFSCFCLFIFRIWLMSYKSGCLLNQGGEKDFQRLIA